MLKNYELLYIIHPDLEGTSDKVFEKVAGFIKKNEGEITSQEDWGKRKLAYQIKKNDFGVYILVNFTAESTKVAQVENSLRLSEEILRSMIVIVPEYKEPKKSKKEAKKAAAVTEAKKEPELVAEPKEKTKATTATTKEPVIKETKTAEDAAKEVKKEKTIVTPDRIEAAKKAVKKTDKPKKEEKPEDEKARLKKLDEKLDELLK